MRGGPAARLSLAAISLLALGCDREAPGRCEAITHEDGRPVASADLCVTERGASPRRRLRIGSRAGATGTYRVIAREAYHDDDFHDGEEEAWVVLRVTAVEAAGDGEARYAFQVIEAQATKGGALREEPSLLRGGGQTQVSRRGISERRDWVIRYGKGGPGYLLDDALSQAQLKIPPFLPEEPVGVGARWTVTRSILRSPGRVVYDGIQRTEYTLTGFDGDRISMRADVTEEASEQWIHDITSSLLDESARLLSMRAEGSATFELDLDRIPILTGKTSLWSEDTMWWGFTSGGDGEVIETQTGLEVVVEAAGE